VLSPWIFYDFKLPVKPNEAVKAKEAAKPVKQPGEGKSAKSFKPAKPVSGSKSSSSKKKMPKPHRSGVLVVQI